MKFKSILLVSLVTVFLVTACELPRPGGEADNISPDIPVVTEPQATETPIETGEEPPPPEDTAPAQADGIDPQVVEAVQAPATQVVERNVLLKLNPQASAQARAAEPGPNGIMSADIPTFDQVLQDIGATELEPLVQDVAQAANKDLQTFSAEATGVSQLFKISYSVEQDPVDVADRLGQDPSVEYAEPNYVAGITAEPRTIPVVLTPNDQYFNFQWHLEAIQMPAAWDRATGSGVIVAVVDTGIDFGAPDLADTDRLPGFDFINNDADPTDDQGHGTHVAGTVAQSTNNEIGVAGVAFGARLLPVKVLGANGEGSYEAVIKGIVYAVDQGARVINMSLAGRNQSNALRDAMQYAHERGVIVVAAAGNSGGSVEFPAAYDDFVTAVGATRFDNTITTYSNFGPQIDLMAPGGDVLVDQNNDGFGDGVLQNTFSSSGSGYSYRFFEGTSMASPHVAGLAALLISLNPDAGPDEIKDVMMRTADPNPDIGPGGQFGAGLIQAADAIAEIAGPSEGPTPTDTPTPTATPTDTPTPTVTTEPIDEHDGDLPTNTPTPTLTPTPSETPATPVPPQPTTPAPPSQPNELLTNGDFEGSEGWVFGDTPIRGGYETDIVHSGSRAARIGATSGPDRFSFSSVWQRVTIPGQASQVTLSAYVYPITQEGDGRDVQNIMILNENFRVLRTLSSELSNSPDWELRSYNLSDLAGRTIYVYFSVINRGHTGRLTAMYIDDVSLTWSP